MTFRKYRIEVFDPYTDRMLFAGSFQGKGYKSVLKGFLTAHKGMVTNYYNKKLQCIVLKFGNDDRPNELTGRMYTVHLGPRGAVAQITAGRPDF